MGFIWFYLVLLGFTWVLLGFTGFYWVLLGFTGFYWVLLGFTGFDRVQRVRPGFSASGPTRGRVLPSFYLVFADASRSSVVQRQHRRPLRRQRRAQKRVEAALVPVGRALLHHLVQ